MLSAFGHQVLTAADGVEGVAIAIASRPDIALIDIGLPSIDGYEVARRLRQHPDTCNTKLIALTGYGLDEDRRRALAAGFDMHLVKPIDADSLAHATSTNAPPKEDSSLR